MSLILNNSKEELRRNKFTFKYNRIFFHILRLQKRNKDNNLNYFTHNSFAELIVSSILLALHINMQKYELRFYLLIPSFSAFESSYV